MEKLRYGTFQNANNKGADQTARMRRLVCACVGRKPPKTGFLAARPNYDVTIIQLITSYHLSCYDHTLHNTSTGASNVMMTSVTTMLIFIERNKL